MKLYREQYHLRNRDKIIRRVNLWGKENPEKLKRNKEKWYEENKDDFLKWCKERYINNKKFFSLQAHNNYLKNREYIKNKTKKYYRDNIITERKRRKQYKKDRLKNDIDFKIQENLRKRMNNCVHGHNKYYHYNEYMICTAKELREYLENKFTPGMTWDNYGKRWDIDHIRPCSSFNWDNPDDHLLCSHFLNLQPLWKHDNILKGYRYDENDKKIWAKTEKNIKQLQKTNSKDREFAISKFIKAARVIK